MPAPARDAGVFPNSIYAGEQMRLDVPTLDTLALSIFVGSTLVLTCLSHAFAQTKALRYWAVGLALMCGSMACCMAYAATRGDVWLIASAALNLQYRVLTWSGVRRLFGASARLGAGFAACGLFWVLYGAAVMFERSLIEQAVLVAFFFTPFRLLTIREVSRRHWRDTRLGRIMVGVANGVLAISALAPLALTLAGSGKSALLIGSPASASALYAVAFASDVLLVAGLIVLAMQQVIAEEALHARLDKGIMQAERTAGASRAGDRRGLAVPAHKGDTERHRRLPWSSRVPNVRGLAAHGREHGCGSAAPCQGVASCATARTPTVPHAAQGRRDAARAIVSKNR